MTKKKTKLATPEWILEGYDSPADYNKAKGLDKKKKVGKTFKIKICPECGSDNVGLVLSNIDSEEESNTGREWECRKCKWKGFDVEVKELTEDEMMKYLDDKGEKVA
ncbi:MAG: hypothetical protein GW939_00940 [Candidatus Magasanikbacteria bacterium]|nr:hypothetical protein [Candidatus Magasanikbacteria bacterium]